MHWGHELNLSKGRSVIVDNVDKEHEWDGSTLDDIVDILDNPWEGESPGASRFIRIYMLM